MMQINGDSMVIFIPEDMQVREVRIGGLKSEECLKCIQTQNQEQKVSDEGKKELRKVQIDTFLRELRCKGESITLTPDQLRVLFPEIHTSFMTTFGHEERAKDFLFQYPSAHPSDPSGMRGYCFGVEWIYGSDVGFPDWSMTAEVSVYWYFMLLVDTDVAKIPSNVLGYRWIEREDISK